MSKVTKALPLPELFYHAKSKDYFIQNDRGMWITVNEGSAKRHLISQGFSGEKNNGISPLDTCLSNLQLRQDVQYAASLAGYDSGLYEINTRRILVTDSPKLIEPKKGDWPLLEGIFEGMFSDPAHDQRPYFFGWLKVGVGALRAKQWQPGQVLAMAGPIQSAKSLIQGLVTKALGGRSAKPYQYMTGVTAFNADLFAAEHLMIEDVAESTDIRKRRAFGANIKAFAVNQEQHCHGKNQQALTLTPRWRVSITLNDEPERLLVLPPLDEDISDKITLLNVAKREMPMPTATPKEQAVFWNALMAELPAFLHYLDQWPIPPELKSPRFGIIHYHHPVLLAALEALSPELQLLEMVDAEVFHDALRRENPWVGTAADLRTYLTGENRDNRRAAETLLHSPVAAGTHLARLAAKRAERVSLRRINGVSQYTINAPVRENNPAA